MCVCMYIYIYIYTSVNPVHIHAQSKGEQSRGVTEHSATESSFFEQCLRAAISSAQVPPKHARAVILSVLAPPGQA